MSSRQSKVQSYHLNIYAIGKIEYKHDFSSKLMKTYSCILWIQYFNLYYLSIYLNFVVNYFLKYYYSYLKWNNIPYFSVLMNNIYNQWIQTEGTHTLWHKLVICRFDSRNGDWFCLKHLNLYIPSKGLVGFSILFHFVFPESIFVSQLF